MKSKLYALLFSFLFVYSFGFSQCSPDPIYTTLGVPGMWPSTVQGIPDGTEGVSYSQTFTMIVPQDTTIDLGVPLGTVTADISKISITGITGYPSGMSTSCSPSNCEYPGNSNGCFLLDGTPSASGTYTVSISLVAEVVYMMQTIALPSYDVDYQLVINPSGGGCPAPTCSFTASVNNLLVDFTDGSTVIGITTYSWNFDDGTYSTEQNPSHTFISEGTYNVCLAVSDSCGGASSCQAVTVTDPGTGCANPIATFTSSVVGLQVTYANASTTTGSVNYLWDFDDGITSTEANPMHAFPTDGTYNVCLAVTDSCGVDSVCESVTVAALPLGLEDISLNDFVLIPNPTNGVVKLAGSKGELSIYDIYGKQIIEKTSDRSLDLSQFKTGVYWLKLIDQNGKLHVQKLIKQ